MRVVTSVWNGKKRIGVIVESWSFIPDDMGVPIEGEDHIDVLNKVAHGNPQYSYREGQGALT